MSGEATAVHEQATAVHEQATAVHEQLLAWYALHGRDLPWRHTHDPYAILVSEMMLQQTGVERVLPRYTAWLERYPTPRALADAATADVIRQWSGLGYNSRAVRLQGIARQVIREHGGRLPATVEGLLALKGIGPYTAGAVACFAYEQDVAFVDTNVRRVLGRVFLGAGDDAAGVSKDDAAGVSEKAMRALAGRVLPRGRAWAWHQALMDLGATICTDTRPACLVCPLQTNCRSAFRAGHAVRESGIRYAARRKEGPWRGSTRYYRGRIVAALGALAPGERMAVADLAARIAPAGEPADAPDLEALLARLAADGLVALTAGDDGRQLVSLPD